MKKKTIDEKTIAEKFTDFFVNFGPKLTSAIPLSKAYFEQYVEYEVPNLKRKEFCNEGLKNVFSPQKSYKRPGHDDISSNVIMSVSEEIFSVIKRVKLRCLSGEHEDCLCYSNF